MRLNPAWLSIALLCGIGCSALRDRLSQARGTPIIKVEGPTFDGKWVYGRLLVGAEDGGYVVIDRRLVEHGIIVVDDVFDCDGGSTVSYIAVDALITPPGDDDFLSIESGYWYGATSRSRSTATTPPRLLLPNAWRRSSPSTSRRPVRMAARAGRRSGFAPT